MTITRRSARSSDCGLSESLRASRAPVPPWARGRLGRRKGPRQWALCEQTNERFTACGSQSLAGTMVRGIYIYARFNRSRPRDARGADRVRENRNDYVVRRRVYMTCTCDRSHRGNVGSNTCQEMACTIGPKLSINGRTVMQSSHEFPEVPNTTQVPIRDGNGSQ